MHDVLDTSTPLIAFGVFPGLFTHEGAFTFFALVVRELFRFCELCLHGKMTRGLRTVLITLSRHTFPPIRGPTLREEPPFREVPTLFRGPLLLFFVFLFFWAV
jgi:hypothetical protein